MITHDSFFGFFFDVMPIFWLVSFVTMLGIGYSTIRHTERGYRFSYYVVVLASVVASALGGVTLYTLGVAGDIDGIRGPLPFGQPIITLEEQRWNDHTRGLVSGIVKSYDSDAQLLTLTLFSGGEKLLSTGELDQSDIILLHENNRVRIIGGGATPEDGIRIACAVLPWDIIGRPHSSVRASSGLFMTHERNENNERSSICKDVRPYQRYKQVIISQ
jgi:hypothetical protein